MSTYKIDPSHSSANFSVKHMMMAKVHGGFDKMSGTLLYDPKNPKASQVDVTIDVASISTRDSQRDTHLRSRDFFDVENFPTITFKSNRITSRKGELKIMGDLTIHGVTNSVTLDAKAPTEEMVASATAKIKRKDFGLKWNAALEAGGFLVSDDVNITLDVQFIKA